MNSRLLWHYTNGKCFSAIGAEGVIRPATDHVPPGEKPAVWFSFNQVWERTATKGFIKNGILRDATLNEMLTIGGGLVRIAVDPETAPHSWVRFRHLSGINPVHAKQLAVVAKSRGANPNDWRVSFDPIPAAKWIAVEEWREGRWVTLIREGVKIASDVAGSSTGGSGDP